MELEKEETLNMSKEITNFFEGLGYKVGWNCNYRIGKTWHEISNDKGLVCQIDMGVPLSNIIIDFQCFHLGVAPTSNIDYDICVNDKDSPNFKKLLETVYNKTVMEFEI